LRKTKHTVRKLSKNLTTVLSVDLEFKNPLRKIEFIK
jgi:hypothetical protein